MNIYTKSGHLITEYVIHVIDDKNGNPVYSNSKVRIFTDLLGGEYYYLPKEIIVCEIIWENGGFHAINYQTSMQFPLWNIDHDSIEVI
jgi:hypothetical protein